MNHILVVDDQKDVANLYKTIIESANHKCTVAYSGKEALSVIKKTRFDIILLDIAMPDIDGITVLKKLSEYPNFSESKIIFVTAELPNGQTKETLTRLGAKNVVIKPINKREMLKLISYYLT